jgi:hypothetical protein
MIANAEHSEATGLLTLLPGACAFFEGVLSNTPRPSFTWSMDPVTGDISIITKTKPTDVILRFATTFDATRRDFRLVKGNTPTDPCEFIPVKVRVCVCGFAASAFTVCCHRFLATRASTLSSGPPSPLRPPLWTTACTRTCCPSRCRHQAGVVRDIFSFALCVVAVSSVVRSVGFRPASCWSCRVSHPAYFVVSSAFLGELHYPGPNGQEYIMTTQVSIIPNTFPFPKCVGYGCKGNLV